MNITVVEMVARSEFDFLMMYITETVISFKYSAIALWNICQNLIELDQAAYEFDISSSISLQYLDRQGSQSVTHVFGVNKYLMMLVESQSREMYMRTQIRQHFTLDWLVRVNPFRIYLSCKSFINYDWHSLSGRYSARICFLTTLLVVLHHLDVRFKPQMQRANLS